MHRIVASAVQTAETPAPVQHTGAPRAAGRALPLAAAAAFSALLIWLAWPVLRPAHVEGFSASIQSLAMHLAGDAIGRYDPVFPLQTEFFASSRFGMVLAAAAGYLIAPDSGAWPMRLLLWAATVALVACSTALVRRWTGAPTWLALASVAVLPGVFEAGFFYNDNVLSAALWTGALLLLEPAGARSRLIPVQTALAWPQTATPPAGAGPGLGRCALAGLLLGLAIVVRADALVLAVAMPLLLWRHLGSGRRFVTALAVGAVATALPVLLLPALLHFSLLDTLRIANHVVALWNRGLSLPSHARSVLLMVGVPGLVLGLCGAVALLRQRWGSALLLLAGVPLLFNLVSLGKLWEMRQLLALAPCFATLALLGGAWVWRHAASLGRVAVFGALALVLVLPPKYVWMSDGPHAVRGRLWTPLLWFTWQDAVRQDFARLHAAIAGLPDQALLVSDDFTTDRSLHLALQEAGYRAQPNDRQWMAHGNATQRCDALLETFRRGDRTVRHLRLSLPFVDDYRQLMAKWHDRFVERCPQRLADPMVYIAPTFHLVDIDPSVRIQTAFGSYRWQLYLLSQIDSRPLDAQHFAALRDVYLRKAALANAEAREKHRDTPADRNPDAALRALTPMLDAF